MVLFPANYMWHAASLRLHPNMSKCRVIKSLRASDAYMRQ